MTISRRSCSNNYYTQQKTSARTAPMSVQIFQLKAIDVLHPSSKSPIGLVNHESSFWMGKVCATMARVQKIRFLQYPAGQKLAEIRNRKPISSEIRRWILLLVHHHRPYDRSFQPFQRLSYAKEKRYPDETGGKLDAKGV